MDNFFPYRLPQVQSLMPFVGPDLASGIELATAWRGALADNPLNTVKDSPAFVANQ